VYIFILESEEEKLDWMSSINASIEGSPAQVQKHAKSFRKRYNRIVCRFCIKISIFFCQEHSCSYIIRIPGLYELGSDIACYSIRLQYIIHSKVCM
jgi:hypothetical protein